jgi:predicted transcriptional regulator
MPNASSDCQWEQLEVAALRTMSAPRSLTVREVHAGLNRHAHVPYEATLTVLFRLCDRALIQATGAAPDWRFATGVEKNLSWRPRVGEANDARGRA